MSDTTTATIENETLATDLNTTETSKESENQDLPKHLRSLYNTEKKKREELEAKLKGIEEQELEKTKTLEEKLAEKETKIKEVENTSKQEINKLKLEKKLVSENINPEFLDLILEKASKLVSSDLSDADDVLTDIKAQFPSAFITKGDKTEVQPIGKVGLSAITSNNSLALTKEQVLAKLQDPNQPITPELKKLINEYRL